MPASSIEICDLSQHPEYARRVGEVVSLWSMIELQLSIIFGTLLRAPPWTAWQAFSAITNARSRTEMVRALTDALDHRLPERDELINLINRVQKAPAGRNRYAHRPWIFENGKLYQLETPAVPIFELQDKVASSVAGVIEPTLQAAEIRRSSERPTSDLTAYDLYLRTLLHVTARERERLQCAFDFLRQAVEHDPNYGPALAQIAYYHYQLDLHGWAEDRELNRRKSIDLARQALRSAPDDPEVLVHAAHVFGYFDEDIDAAVALVDRALVLNPSYASGWYWSGVVRNWVGRPDLALEHFATFLRLSPRERFPFYLTAIGIALFFDRRFDEAAAKLHESLQRFPNLGLTYRFLAASYAHLGRIGEAREIAEQMRAMNLGVLESGTRYRNVEYRELYLSGLRLAAGETP